MEFLTADKADEYFSYAAYILLTVLTPKEPSGPQIRPGSNFSQACPRSSYPADGPTCISFQHRAQ